MWLKNWFLGFMMSRFTTARDIVRFGLRFFGGNLMLVDRRGSFTYRQVGQRALQLSAAMEAGGIGKGDVVFSWLPETGEQLELRLATFENGAILAMFHQFLPAERALQTLSNLRPKLFVHDPVLSAGLIERVRTQFPAMVCLALGDEYERFVASQPARRSQAVLGPQDYASLHLTSGTTGQPKAIGVTHAKYLRQLRMMGADLSSKGAKAAGRAKPDVLLLGMPLTGPGGGFVLPALLVGSALVVPTDYSVPKLTELIARWRVTRTFFSPSTIIDLLDDPQRDSYDFSSVRNIVYGSEMMSAAKLAEAIALLGPIFQQGYGSFEAMPPLTWLRPQDHVESDGSPASLDVLGSAGYVATDVEIKVVGDDFERVQDGEMGRIVVKTPLAFSGYWGRPELDDATLFDGWVITGDMGYFDTHQRLHVMGRQADTVHRHGQEIYPRQVEEVAHLHPAVREACLVEVRDEAHLVVTLRHAWRKSPNIQTLTQSIQEHFDQNLAFERHPDRIHIFDTIPRSFLNKMLRREVRDQLLASARDQAPVVALAGNDHSAATPQRFAA